MIFESFCSSLESFLLGLSPFELVLFFLFELCLLCATVLGLLSAIVFYRWTLRDDDEDDDKEKDR